MAYTLVPTELIVDGAITSAKLDTNISISGTLGVTGELTLATHMIMGDNDKIKIGTGGDLEIYHDGSNSYISNSTGNIYLADTNGSVHIQAKLNEESIVCTADGAVSLYHDNAVKLATSSSGIDVTGTVTADGLTVDGTGTFNNNIGVVVSALTPSIRITETDITDKNTQLIQASGTFRIRTASDDYSTTTERMRIDHSTGDISFYEDTGTTAKLFWDASAESLGIGTTSPAGSGLHIKKDTLATTNELLRLSNSAGSTTDGVKIVMEVANTSGNGGEIGVVRDGGSFNPYMFFSTSSGVGSSPTEAMRIGSNNKIGVATTSTDHQLTVNASAFDGIQLQSGGSDCGYLGVNTDTVYVGAGSNLIFHTGNAGLTNGTERMRIDSSGNVGIGGSTITDSNLLNLQGSGASKNIGIVFNDTNTSKIFSIQNGGSALKFFDYTASTERMRIDSSGNVGIGVSSPQAKLQLLDTDAVYLQWTDSGNIAGRIGVNGSYMHFGLDGANGETERMRIDSSGNLLVGTTSAIGPGIIMVKSTATTTGCLGMHNTNNGGSFIRFANAANNAVIGVIQNNNDNSTSYLTTSDYRLKENVVEMTGALDRINQLQPKRFNFIADETNTLVDGFLAHEVSDIVPEAISGEKDAVDDEGNPDYQGIDQSKLVPLLTKAIQEQQTIIDDLKSRIETLENE